MNRRTEIVIMNSAAVLAAAAATFCAIQIVRLLTKPPETPVPEPEKPAITVQTGVTVIPTAGFTVVPAKKVPETRITYLVVPETENEDKAENISMQVEIQPEQPENTKSNDYSADVTALAQMAWGEARGCGDDGIRAVMWCVMHRLDAGYADTVLGVVSAPGQFYGYSASHPVDDHIAALASEVLGAHAAGETPLLPEGYVYFTGDGVKNIFRNGAGERWTV